MYYCLACFVTRNHRSSLVSEGGVLLLLKFDGRCSSATGLLEVELRQLPSLSLASFLLPPVSVLPTCAVLASLGLGFCSSVTGFTHDPLRLPDSQVLIHLFSCFSLSFLLFGISQQRSQVCLRYLL